MKRKALKKLLKKNGFKYGGLYRNYYCDEKGSTKHTFPKIIVFYSGIAEYHIMDTKSGYSIRDVGCNGKFCKTPKEILDFLMECEEKWYEWVAYQERMAKEAREQGLMEEGHNEINEIFS